jgi:hypothetical protein
MKKIRYISATIIVWTTLVLVGCTPFSKYELNPNAPSQGQVSPTLVLTNVITSTMGAYNPLYGTNYGWAQNIASISSQQGDAGFQGYLGGEASFGWYSTLRDVTAMVNEGTRINTPAYKGIGNFFKAYCLIDMSMQMGDIPMSEALLGESVYNFTPKYDTQIDVFNQCLSLLEEADTILGAAVEKKVSVGTNELLYGGDVAKWQKLVNSLQLRILIDLSKKADTETAMGIKSKFAEIVNNPDKHPIFTSNDDNATFRWYDKENNRYPRFYVQATSDYYRIGNTYYNLIKKYNDPRIAIVAERTANAVAANPTASGFDVNEYGGVNCNDAYASIEATKNAASIFNRSRYCTATGEPMIIVGYPEQCFNIAEAINRGWLAGNAETYYNEGISASMENYGIPESTIATYLDQPSVKYGDSLEQILNQKYIAFFNNSGWEAFYNIRRTGIPQLQIGAGMANPSGKIPVRWRYPQREYTTNETNVQAAIQSQFAGSDGVDDIMWINKL